VNVIHGQNLNQESGANGYSKLNVLLDLQYQSRWGFGISNLSQIVYKLSKSVCGREDSRWRKTVSNTKHLFINLSSAQF